MKDNVERNRKEIEMQEEIKQEYEFEGCRVERLKTHVHLWRVTPLGTSVDPSLSGALFTSRQLAEEAISRTLKTK